jgi:hypothetical protein
MSTAKKASRPGRPAGSPNIEYKRAAATPPHCPTCLSTDREPYGRILTTIKCGGISPDGWPYTHVVKRATQCRACGQYYTVSTYENRTTPDEDPEP